jgi:branched-chain amino acid transport system substrate-binding protein
VVKHRNYFAFSLNPVIGVKKNSQISRPCLYPTEGANKNFPFIPGNSFAYHMAKRLLNIWLVLLFLILTGSKFKDPINESGSDANLPFPLAVKEFHQSNDTEKIKIGLLLPVSPDKDMLSRSAMQGAELAVEQTNQAGGYDGQYFELVVRTADGLWGAGSKESVKLVHDDGVVAIVTAVDGRNAHLVEQVVAKSHVVQIATRATEETLSQAYVPWFFRIVPNDKQQSIALIEEVYEKNGFMNVHLLIEDENDHLSGAKTLKKLIKKSEFKIAGQTMIPDSGSDDINVKLEDNMEALIVFGSFSTAKPYLDKIRYEYPSINVFGALSMTADGQIGSEYSEGCDGGIFVSSKFCFTTAGQAFKDAYKEKHKQLPNPAASYAFDGVNLIIEAIKKAGPDREKIRDVLKEINYAAGATGPIQFDGNGNRTSPVFMIRMIKGHPVLLKQ